MKPTTTRVQADFKNHPDALRRMLQRAKDNNRSAGAQLVTESLIFDARHGNPTKNPARKGKA